MQRIHVVGSGPRTGTTLIAQLMISSFDIDVHSNNENSNHEDRIGKVPPRNGDVFLSKSPKDIVVIEPIMKWVKNLHVIYILRDPRDMIVSRHRSDPDNYFSNLGHYFNYRPFAESLKNHPRFIQIRYEDLVSNPDEVQDEIHRKLPFLKKLHKFSEFHKVAKPSTTAQVPLGSFRAVSGQSIGNWKEHKPRILGQIMDHGSITDDLIAFGYEKDASWEKELEGVEPEHAPPRDSNFHKASWVKNKQRTKYLRAARVWFYHLPITLKFLDFRYRLKHGKEQSS